MLHRVVSTTAGNQDRTTRSSSDEPHRKAAAEVVHTLLRFRVYLAVGAPLEH